MATWARTLADDANLASLLVVVGSRDDLTKWFRQIPLCSADWHKQVYHWNGKFIVDTHVQMGRQSSADGAQRLSFICAAIVFERVEAILAGKLQAPTTALWKLLKCISERRQRATGRKGSSLWQLDVMQDDLGYAALTFEVGTIVRDAIPVVLAEYGVEVPMGKRAEDEAAVEGPQPNQVILFIGGQFDTTDVTKPMVRGQEKTIRRLEGAVKEWEPLKPGEVAGEKLYQRAIGGSARACGGA